MDIKALMYVLGVTLAHIIFINMGYFDSVTTELGYEMYAERPDSIPFLNNIPMPMNTFVNFGYFLVGAYWFAVFATEGNFYGECFSWYSMVYCFIQLTRIVYQTQRSAVLDQWITTTIFCHVMVWVTRIPCDGIVTRLVRAVDHRLVILISFFSYFLACVSQIGFDLSLGVHILLAVAVGI